MSATIVQAIYDRLAGDTGASSFHAAIGGKYYHLETPENTEPPLCVYGVDDPAPLVMHYDGTEREIWRFRFVVYVLNTAQNPDVTALGIDAKLRLRLHNATLTGITGYDRLVILCEQQGFATKDEDATRVESVYRVFGTRTT